MLINSFFKSWRPTFFMFFVKYNLQFVKYSFRRGCPTLNYWTDRSEILTIHYTCIVHNKNKFLLTKTKILFFVNYQLISTIFFIWDFLIIIDWFFRQCSYLRYQLKSILRYRNWNNRKILYLNNYLIKS